MRVLIATGLYPPDIGGPATCSKMLTDGLPAAGIATEVVSFGRFRNYWPVIRHAVFFASVLSRGKHADVLYAQDTVSVGIPTALANVFLRKKFMVRIPGDHVWEQGTRRFGIAGSLEKFPVFSWEWHPYLICMRVLQQWVVGSADALVVPSRYLFKVVKRWRVREKKIFVIYNGVEHIKNPGNRQVLRGLLKFNGKLLISVGRLVPWKGFGTLIEILPRLKQTLPDTKLLIAGGGPLLEELMEKARLLNLEGDVIFTGNLDRDVLLRYVRIADVFVLNSRYEGLSHQLLETMAVGIPVVATAVGGNMEVIEDGINGFLVAPDDREALLSRIISLLTDQQLRERIALAGRKKVKQFSNDRMVLETVRLLKKICAS